MNLRSCMRCAELKTFNPLKRQSPQNGQTHSNNLPAKADVFSMFDRFVGLALKIQKGLLLSNIK